MFYIFCFYTLFSNDEHNRMPLFLIRQQGDSSIYWLAILSKFKKTCFCHFFMGTGLYSYMIFVTCENGLIFIFFSSGCLGPDLIFWSKLSWFSSGVLLSFRNRSNFKEKNFFWASRFECYTYRCIIDWFFVLRQFRLSETRKILFAIDRLHICELTNKILPKEPKRY